MFKVTHDYKLLPSILLIKLANLNFLGKRGNSVKTKTTFEVTMIGRSDNQTN